MAVEITEEFVWQNIPPRARDSHKGTFGSVLAVAGSAFYRGAALLAAEEMCIRDRKGTAMEKPAAACYHLPGLFEFYELYRLSLIHI